MLLLSGCAFAPQSARIHPTAQVAESSIGKGVTVTVKVVDDRPDQAIGKRGVGGAGADIVPANKVEVAIQDLIVDCLRKHGFNVDGGEATANANLTVEVRFLNYAVSTGFWSGGVNVKVALKAIATNGGRSYEHLYRTDREERVQIIPTADTNEKWINEALSKTVQELLDDGSLLDVLAGKR